MSKKCGRKIVDPHYTYVASYFPAPYDAAKPYVYILSNLAYLYYHIQGMSAQWVNLYERKHFDREWFVGPIRAGATAFREYQAKRMGEERAHLMDIVGEVNFAIKEIDTAKNESSECSMKDQHIIRRCDYMIQLCMTCLCDMRLFKPSGKVDCRGYVSTLDTRTLGFYSGLHLYKPQPTVSVAAKEPMLFTRECTWKIPAGIYHLTFRDSPMDGKLVFCPKPNVKLFTEYLTRYAMQMAIIMGNPELQGSFSKFYLDGEKVLQMKFEKQCPQPYHATKVENYGIPYSLYGESLEVCNSEYYTNLEFKEDDQNGVCTWCEWQEFKVEDRLKDKSNGLSVSIM